MVEIGQQYAYAKVQKDGKPLTVTVKEIRESMSGEKIPYVLREDGSGQCFTCPMEDLTPKA